MLAIGTGNGPPDLEAAIRVADSYPFVFATVGVHPNDAPKADAHTIGELKRLLEHPKVVAMGEIGLDYHWGVPKETQLPVFIQQLGIAAAAGMPVVIHTRDAWDDTIEVLRQHWAPVKLPCILHCFTGNAAQARQCLELGFYLAFGGVTTFSEGERTPRSRRNGSRGPAAAGNRFALSCAGSPSRQAQRAGVRGAHRRRCRGGSRCCGGRTRGGNQRHVRARVRPQWPATLRLRIGMESMFSHLRQSLSAREAFELVQPDLEQVEREISVETVASVEAITAINQYLQTGGGKRLRPALLLLCNRLFGDSTAGARRLAAVVEMIHSATLVHDDVIDVARTRRGRPSTNVVWGNHISVLSGDWLYMQAFQVALRERNFRILDALISLTQMMVEGELLQLERLHRVDITEADYMELVDRKTASLFSACACLGAISGGADEATEAKLSDFAWNLGMAFQLVDDILDFTSTEKILGKPSGNDLREGKVTLPMIYALEAASAEERQAIETVVADAAYEQVPFMRIRQMLERHGAVARVYERAHAFTEKSRAILDEFPRSAAQRSLLAIVDLVTERSS